MKVEVSLRVLVDNTTVVTIGDTVTHCGSFVEALHIIKQYEDKEAEENEGKA